MKRKLGKTPARHAMRYKFTDVFDPSNLPTPPPVFGHHAAVAQYHMLGNDTWGNCVWAGAAHNQYIWSLMGSGERTHITTKDTLDDYAAVTGFAYTDATDNGTDMTLAAQYWKETGIRDSANNRHKIDAYASIQVGNLDELFLAIYLTGASGVGIQLPESAETQSDANGEGKTGVPWTVPNKVRAAGGHYVSGVGRDDAGNLIIVTWGTVQTMTPTFYQRFNDENAVYFSLETLNAKGLSPEGFDASTLRDIMRKL